MSSNVIPFDELKRVEPKCSFCKKSESQVKNLISNNRTDQHARYICNECVVKAKQRLQAAV